MDEPPQWLREGEPRVATLLQFPSFKFTGTYITFVSVRGGDDFFAASVTDDDTNGGTSSIEHDGNGNRVTEEVMGDDFPPASDPMDDELFSRNTRALQGTNIPMGMEIVGEVEPFDVMGGAMEGEDGNIEPIDSLGEEDIHSHLRHGTLVSLS